MNARMVTPRDLRGKVGGQQDVLFENGRPMVQTFASPPWCRKTLEGWADPSRCGELKELHVSASRSGVWIPSSESTMGGAQTVHDSKQNSGPGAPGVDIISAGRGETLRRPTHRQMLPGKRGGLVDAAGLGRSGFRKMGPEDEGSNRAALVCRV